MNLKQLIGIIQIIAAPLIIWLLYRLFFAGGFTKPDYAVMAIFFILLLVRDQLRRKLKKMEEKGNG